MPLPIQSQHRCLKSIAEIEEMQHERIKAFWEMLEAEEQELRSINAARSSSPTEHENRLGTVHAPATYSDKMAWKDKIILLVAEAKRPLLAREIGPILKLWEPKGKH
jgi:hypothetical protein